MTSLCRFLVEALWRLLPTPDEGLDAHGYPMARLTTSHNRKVYLDA